ncbi:uncharacterized protein LOC125674391 [Ostrea edulis]|uniref:uncharacterized protein LOC125674391 n=1 Tax=Ostrea edulis TaxID=37623 RepID=UPI0024AFFB01|nr:uncharacterized protein LOC125674391 [Ostrea edulis]XP_056016021.1 uncharacterized protein LOC125674391 [Ostrea edulis]
MATSAPLAKAQDVKHCQLCLGKDSKSAAETVCNTCHVNLCKDCVGHHVTSNPNIRHDVVTFQFKILEIILTPCKLHQNQKCKMFCEKCDSPICLKCHASGSHENHDVSQISEIHISRKQLIEKDTKELESNIAPVFESILSEIEEMLSNVLQKHGERQQVITEFGKRCHTLIDIVINRYLNDSKKIAKQDGDSIQTLKSEFEKLQSSIQSAIHENHSILASNDLSKFTSYASRNEQLRNVPSRFELTVPPLNPRELTEEALKQFIGVIPTSIKTDIPGQVLQVIPPVSSVNKPNKKLLEKPEVLAALNTGYSNTFRVCCIPNTDEFYVCGDSDIIRHMNTEGTLLEEIATKSGKYPADLTITRKGHLVYTNWGDSCINRQKNGKIECLIRLEGRIPQGICTTSTDGLLVTMVSNDGQSKVVHYSGSTVKQEIQYSDTDSNPAFITENKNLDIVVSDTNTRAVVVVDKGGKFRFSYNGNLQLKKSFIPGGVTTDSMCHILIADRDNHVIHIIDQNGQFLWYINNCNLQQPYDLSTDNNDMLFVTEYETNIVKHIKYSE